LKQEDTPLGIHISSVHLGTTLCIPTVFISYTGEALDYKTPLLRAYRLWMKQRQMFVNILIKCKESTATLGWEQEYF
jgi:glutamine synthetase